MDKLKQEIENVITESSLLRTVSDKQLKDLEKKYKLENKSENLHELLGNDMKDLLALLSAASDAIMLAGETVSGDVDLVQQLKKLSKERREGLYDYANYLTIVRNFEDIIRVPAECDKFIAALNDEARNNLYIAIDELKRSQEE